MSAAKHTPGPWYLDEDARPGMEWNRHVYSGPHTAVCFMAHSGGKDPARDRATARLIAAAPDMLDALIDCAAGYRDPELFLPQVLAAIRKATGAQS